jgi:hypothetical protein
VDRPGTGNVTELSKEQRRYRSVRFTGQHYTSTQDGVTVINARAEPLGHTTTAVSLAQVVAGEISYPAAVRNDGELAVPVSAYVKRSPWCRSWCELQACGAVEGVCWCGSRNHRSWLRRWSTPLAFLAVKGSGVRVPSAPQL